MPVPSAITDLSQTAGSNSPSGSESPITTDNYLRQHAAFIAALRDGTGFSDPVTVASGSTVDIGGQSSMFVEISGTTTITSFGTSYNGPRFIRFTGALTLTHGSALNLPGAASITTVAGDTALAAPNLAGNGWNVLSYARGAALPAGAGANTDITSLSAPAIGAATATTQAATDSSTKVATTAFVRSVGPAVAAINGYSTNTTLTTSNYGQFLYLSGTMTLTLPVADPTNIGRTITCYCFAVGAITVATQSSQTMYYQGTSTTTSAPLLLKGDMVTFVNYNGSAWMAMSASCFGVSQAWTGSGYTTAGATYTNTSGKPMVFQVSGDLSSSSSYIYITVNGVNLRGATGPSGAGFGTSASAIIPPNTTYSFNVSAGSLSNIAAFILT